jgi:hypothetical protein
MATCAAETTWVVFNGEDNEVKDEVEDEFMV